jgi:hypothetical protein
MNYIFLLGGWAIPRRVLVLLAIATVAELAEVMFDLPSLATVDFVIVTWAAVPCLLAAALIVRYPHRHRLAIAEPRAFAYVVLLVIAVMFGALYIRSNGYAITLAILAAVSLEEIVYRFALPALLSLLMMQWGVNSRHAMVFALVTSTALFIAMPAHVTQMDDLRSVMAFIAFSILMAHAVWRGRSLFAPIVAHAAYDFATIGMQNGDVSSLLRVAGAGASLLALMVIAAHPRMRVIDLREPIDEPVVGKPLPDESRVRVLTRI